MKRMLFLFALLLIISNQSFAVKHSSIRPTEITLHNFSSNQFDATNMKMTINNQWFSISALTLMSGSLIAPAGSDIVLGGFNLPLSGGSVALWYGTVDECNPSAFDMASFVQYGFAGNAFEALAVSVNLWGAGDYVHGGPPLTRDTDWSSDGAQHWSGTILSLAEQSILETIEIGPIPFNEHFIIRTNQTENEFSLELFNISGHLNFQRQAIKEKEVVVNTVSLQQGVYFLRITDSNGESVTKRLIKSN